MLKFVVIFLLYQIIHGNPIDNPEITIEDANQLDSPWLVLLEINELICGGNLIQGRYIVTAAHCLESINSEDYENEAKLTKILTIKLGEWKTDMDPDCDNDIDEQICEPLVKIRPKSIILHEEYKPDRLEEKYENDIAMIKLAWPPRNSSLISSIKLPSADECDEAVENQTWTVTGFGLTPNKVFSKTKKKIELTMITEEECDDIIKADDSVYYHKGTHICGKGTRGESTCIGDSGSGATKNTDEGPVLQGIVSFGSSECGTLGAPSGLLKIACYADWIKNAINQFKINDPSDDDDDDDDDNNSKGNDTDEDRNKDTSEDKNESDDENDENRFEAGRTLTERTREPRLRFQHVRRPQ